MLLDTGAVKEEETTKEIVSLDNEKADGDGRDMRLAARKNILQIDLVILDDILMEMRFKSKRSASRGFSALVLYVYKPYCPPPSADPAPKYSNIKLTL